MFTIPRIVILLIIAEVAICAFCADRYVSIGPGGGTTGDGFDYLLEDALRGK